MLISEEKSDKIMNSLMSQMKEEAPHLTVVFNVVEFNKGEIYISGQYCPYFEGYPYIIINSIKDSTEYIKKVGTLLHEFGHHSSVKECKPIHSISKSGYIYGDWENNTANIVFTEELFAWVFGFLYLFKAKLNIFSKILTFIYCIKYMLGHYSILIGQYYKCLMHKESFAQNYHYKRFL